MIDSFSTASAAHEERRVESDFYLFLFFYTIHEICLLLFIWCVCVCSMCMCVWEEIRAETSNAHELAKKRKREKIYKKKKYGFFFFSFYKCFSGRKRVVRAVFLGWVFGIERGRNIVGIGWEQRAERSRCMQSRRRRRRRKGVFRATQDERDFHECVCVNEYGMGEHLIHMVYAMYIQIFVLNIEEKH